MVKISLPSKVNIGPFEVELITIPHEVAYESSDYQGSFVSKPPLKIYLDDEIIQMGGRDAINVVIHELIHVGYYQYHLKDKDEETLVNSLANFLTELLCRSEVKNWIVENMRNKK
jgi:hypothetical protein|tara:strand:- start:2825 stop:3169 length:345 start_codon:yes stop_codon:yes gene_type:complete